MKFLPEGSMSEKDTDLQLTPMIDVVFQLLIFFLIGTRFRIPEGELEAYLPEQGGLSESSAPDELKPIIITLRVSQGGAKAEPSVLLDNANILDRVLTSGMSNKMGWLERKMREYGKDKDTRENTTVIIESEPHVAYKWVIRALNICRKAKFKLVNFALSKRGTLAEAGKQKP